MGPPAPRKRWAPRPVDEVCSPARPSGLPLVGASARRLPLAKLPAIVPHTKLPDTERAVFGLPDRHRVNDIEVAAAVSRWLEGGQTSALRLISGLAILKDLKGADTYLKKPKMAFSLLKLLASELLDVLDVSPGRHPQHPPSYHRTWLLKSLVDLLEPSIFASEEMRQMVMQEASHSVALVEDSVGVDRDAAQAMCDIVAVNQWHLKETPQPRLSAQEMWTRRSGLRPSKAPTVRHDGKSDGVLPLVAASNVKRWHCSQLVQQARWTNEIHESLDAQTSAAYNIMGLVRELTGGFADGWAFAFWRYQRKEELIELEQMQKVETSLKINREYLGILFTSWSHLAVSLQIERRKEELNVKKLHLRMLGVRHQEAQDRRQKFEEEQQSDRTVSYFMTRKLQAAQEDKSRVDFRLNTMSPADARRVLHLFMQTFMDFLANFSMTEKMLCKQKMLSKDVLFLAMEASDTIQDIVDLPCEEILCRWINCVIMETKHRASSLLTAGDVEDSRQNWQATDSQKYSMRCFEVRSFPLVQTSSFEEHFKDGKLLTILYTLLRAFRDNNNFFDPAELAALDEKDTEHRVAIALDHFSSLSPMLINRFVMKATDILSGQLACLKSSLCSIFLREAPGIRSMMQAQSLAEDQALHIDEKDRFPRSRRQVILPTDLPRLEDSRKRALEIQYPMAKIMHMFQDVAGRVAFADMFDLSRLCVANETIWSLSRLSLVEILRRWVNLQVFGSVAPQEDGQPTGVTNFGSDLASGRILLKLITAVAGNAIDAEDMRDQVEDCLADSPQREDKEAMKLVIPLVKRCVPYCFLTEDALLAAQEDALSTVVGGLFLSWFTLRPEPESSLGQDLEGIERFLEVGLNVAAMPAEAVPESEDKSGLLDAYCKECDSGEENRLICTLGAIEEHHRVMFSLQTRLRNFIAEVMVRRVVSRRRFKSSRGDGHTLVTLQELVRDQDWILLTENEHPATRSSRPRSVVREKRALIVKLFDYLSIRGPGGERQVYWSGIAQLYRDANMSCPCLFLPKDAAQRIFCEVLDAEPETLQESATLHTKYLHMAEIQRWQESEKDSSWQDYGLSLHGFVRYLLRIAIHREESAFRRQSSAVSLTRSLRELFGSHLQKAECNAAENQFTLSIHTSQVQHLQLSWEPFMRAVFVLYANQGYVSETQEELRMGEASLVSLFSDAGLLGSGLQRATTRSIYQSLTDRRHFQTNKEKICFQGQAEVRRRIKKEGMGRSKSLPPKIQGLQPCVSQLTAQASALHFEDFQEVCLAAAMYRNPNLVVPVELRFEQFLMAMVDGLKHRMASKTEMLPHLMVEAKSIEEAEAKQRAWNELLEALEGCTMGVPDEKWGRRMRATRQLQAREATVKEDEPVRRSRSAPPAVSLPSRFQTILGIAKDSSQSTISALNAAMPTEGSLEGLGLPVGSRLESVVSVMKVAKRFGAHIDVAEVKKKRSDIGKGALDRRRKVATLKVKFLADRQIRAAVLKREQLSQEIQPEG